MKLKSNDDYTRLAPIAEARNQNQNGITGISTFSQILTIPEQCPFDYILLQGHTKWLIDSSFFD